MTSARYLACLDTLGLSRLRLTKLLGCSTRLPRVWGTGAASVPPAIGVWLETCVALRAANPKAKLARAPTGWRRQPAIMVTYQGKRMPLSRACEAAGIRAPNSVRYRVLRYGVTWQTAFNRVVASHKIS